MNTTDERSNGMTTTEDAHQILNAPTTWQLDPAASRVEFTIRKRLLFVKHLLVTGRFADVAGTITLDEQDPANSRAEVTIAAASIDTRNARRDKHLRTADFFDVERYPTLRFSSRRIERIDGAAGRYRVTGDLTVRDVTREVRLDAHYAPANGSAREPRIEVRLAAPLNRRHFGIVWNKSYISVADDLTISLAIEATHA